MLTLVGVENNKLAVKRVLVGRVKGVRAQENLMLGAKEVLPLAGSSWSPSYKQQCFECMWKFRVVFDVVGGIWRFGDFGKMSLLCVQVF